MVHKYTWYFRDAFCLRSLNSTMTGKDVIFLVDNDRIDKSEFTQRRTEFQNLFFVMGSCVVGIWDELVNGNKLKFCSCIHQLPLLRIIFFIPLRAASI